MYAANQKIKYDKSNWIPFNNQKYSNFQTSILQIKKRIKVCRKHHKNKIKSNRISISFDPKFFCRSALQLRKILNKSINILEHFDLFLLDPICQNLLQAYFFAKRQLEERRTQKIFGGNLWSSQHGHRVGMGGRGITPLSPKISRKVKPSPHFWGKSKIFI